MGLANIGGILSKQIDKRNFIQAYSNYQFSDWYLGLNRKNSEFLKCFSSIDAEINFRSNISDDVNLNMYSYILKENFTSEYSLLNYIGLLNSDGIRNFNIMNIDFLKRSIYSKINMGASFAKSLFNFGNLNNSKYEKQYYLSIDNQIKLSSNFQLQLGIADDYSYYSFDNTVPRNTMAIYPDNQTITYKYNIDNHNLETYSYFKLYFWNNSSFGVGLRKNIPIKKQKNYISYQTNLKLVLDKSNSILLSAGQYNAYLSPDGIIYDFERIKATQVALDYIFSKNNLSLSLSNYF